MASSALVPRSTVGTRVLKGDRLECQVVSPPGEKLALTGKTSDVEPEVEGSAAFHGNRALVHHVWAFAKFTYLKVSLASQEEQKNAEKRAKAHQKVAKWITELADDLAGAKKQCWCSSCFADTEHLNGQDDDTLVETMGLEPTTPCLQSRCSSQLSYVPGANQGSGGSTGSPASATLKAWLTPAPTSIRSATSPLRAMVASSVSSSAGSGSTCGAAPTAVTSAVATIRGGKHATGHFHSTTHPIIQSFEPREDWFWCYVDEIGFEVEGQGPSPSHT